MECLACGQKFGEHDEVCPNCGWTYKSIAPEEKATPKEEDSASHSANYDYDKVVKLSSDIDRYLTIMSVGNNNSGGCLCHFITMGCLGYLVFELPVLAGALVIYLLTCMIKGDVHLFAARKLLREHKVLEAEAEYKKGKPWALQVIIAEIIFILLPIVVLFSFCASALK